MPSFGDIVQKAFYLGVGLASYASERAGGKLGELRSQAQKLADEMVARGEMTTEEAKRFVEDLMKQAQSPDAETAGGETPAEPRRIEILSEDETGSDQEENVDKLQEKVQKMQEELRRLKRDQ